MLKERFYSGKGSYSISISFTLKPNEFPLKHKIFEKVSTALGNKSNMKTNFKSQSFELLTKTKFITTNRIFKSACDKDILVS